MICAFGIFMATVLASAAGIGGGAVLVPLFTMLGEFTEHEAIPLSIATVFGASAFSTFGNFLWLKHPLVPPPPHDRLRRRHAPHPRDAPGGDDRGLFEQA